MADGFRYMSDTDVAEDSSYLKSISTRGQYKQIACRCPSNGGSLVSSIIRFAPDGSGGMRFDSQTFVVFGIGGFFL